MNVPSIDHSKLEDIAYADSHLDEDEIYLSEDDIEEDSEDAKDTFPEETVVANKKCRIYPKSRHYALIRFGSGFVDKAIALPKVICHEDEMIDGERMMSVINWGQDGWINARRDNSENSVVSWKATLVWTGMRKPGGANNAHHNDEQWRRLLVEYHDLGSVDISMKRVTVPTLKSVASELSGPEKPPAEVKEVNNINNKNLTRSLSLGGRDFSNMLEEIDVTLKDDSDDSESNMSKKPVVVAEDLQFCGTVQKIGKENVTFMPIHVYDVKIPKQYHGSYSAFVYRAKLYAKGELAVGNDLKLEVGDSVSFICDLLFDEESKEKFCDVKLAWNGRKPEPALTSSINEPELKFKKGDGFIHDNKSLEPINVDEGLELSDSETPLVIRNVLGEVKKVNPSSICVQPYKHEYQAPEAHIVMYQNVYFANGKVGSSYGDLTQSDLKVGSHMRMNLSKIDDRIIVLSAWQPGAKCPKNDESKAVEYAKLIRKKNTRKSSPKRSRKPFEEPTPTSQMSARPHSPSYFHTSELRRPKCVKEVALPEPFLKPATPKKSCLREEKHGPSISFSDSPVKTVTLPKTFPPKLKNISPDSYVVPASYPKLSQHVLTFSDRDVRDSHTKCTSFDLDERPKVQVENREFTIDVITKAMDAFRAETALSGISEITKDQFLMWSKQAFLCALSSEIQKSPNSLTQVSNAFERLLEEILRINIKDDNDNILDESSFMKEETSMVDASSQTTITGPVFFRDCFLE